MSLNSESAFAYGPGLKESTPGTASPPHLRLAALSRFGSRAALCLLLAALIAPAPKAAPSRRAVMLVMDKITLTDLASSDLPNLTWCIRHGGIALMNTRTGNGAFAAEHTYVTLGAGSRALGTPTSGAAYAAEENLESGKAAEILARNTGFRARPGSLVLPDVAAVAALNATQDHIARPGLLGTILHQAGLSTCALGNADSLDLPGRQVVSLVMDEHGVVDAGSVGSDLLEADPTQPFGTGTNYTALLRAYDRLAGGAALTAIELGDTARLDAYSLNLTPERRAELARMMLRAADGFLGLLRRRLDLRRTLLLIVCPTPNVFAQEEGNPMTPLIAVGPGFSPGWLVSATTKRPGVVANTDVAPTILSFLNLPIPPEVSGRPLRSAPGRGSLTELLDQDTRIATAALWQQPVLKFYTVLLDAVFILCALFLLWPGLPGARWLQALLLLISGFPLVLLVAPLRHGTAYYLPWLIGLAIILTVLLVAVSRRPLRPLFFLFFGTTAVIVLDQLSGATLARFSLLSYSPIAGARFYGIGNEYMGVVIGAAMMAAGLAYTRWHGRRWLGPASVAGLGALAVVVGAPGLGTNVGGFLAAVVGGGVAVLLFTGKRVSPRTVLLVGGTALGALFLAGLIDALRPTAVQTHLGRLANQVFQGGLTPFWEIAQRKLAMNLKLIRFSGWSRAALFALASILVTAIVPQGRGRDWAARYPYLAKAIGASLAGGIAALIFNDSGIVAAGTLLIFPASAWLYLMLDLARESPVNS